MSVATPLSEFPRDHRPARATASSRVTAGILTALIYAGFAFLMWQRAFWTAQADPPTVEIVAKLLPDLPRKKVIPPPPPFLAHLIRPHAQTVAPPVFTVASAAPAAPSQIPASAAKSSPISGGTPTGTGATGQAVSANGVNGNSRVLAGCLDPAWMRAVTDRVRKYFYYPARAAERHTTGVVKMHFVVRRTGLLDMLEIGKSSGDDALDDAAYNMVRKAQPLPAIPDRMHTDRIDAELPIDFGIPGLTFEVSAGDCG